MKLCEDIFDGINIRKSMPDDIRNDSNPHRYDPRRVCVDYNAEKPVRITGDDYKDVFGKITGFIQHLIKFVRLHPSCSDTEIEKIEVKFGVPASCVGVMPLLRHFPKTIYGHEIILKTKGSFGKTDSLGQSLTDVDVDMKFRSGINLSAPRDFIQFYDVMLLPGKGFDGHMEFIHTMRPRYYHIVGEFADDDELDADWPVWIDFNDPDKSWPPKVLCYLFSNEHSVERLKELVRRKGITYLKDFTDLKFNWE